MWYLQDNMVTVPVLALELAKLLPNSERPSVTITISIRVSQDTTPRAWLP